MLMVMPRVISSGARSMRSKDTNRLADGSRSARIFVIAAVRVVLPWSTCPIVPMLRCGLVRMNWLLAMVTAPGRDDWWRTAYAGGRHPAKGKAAPERRADTLLPGSAAG